MARRSLKADDLLEFVELSTFTRRWHGLGLDVERDLLELRWGIMENPQAGAVLKGTDGIRKVRFAPPTWATGKRGACRVLYVIVAAYSLCILCLVYGKNETDNISEAGKQHLNRAIAEVIRQWPSRREK